MKRANVDANNNDDEIEREYKRLKRQLDDDIEDKLRKAVTRYDYQEKMIDEMHKKLDNMKNDYKSEFIIASHEIDDILKLKVILFSWLLNKEAKYEQIILPYDFFEGYGDYHHEIKSIFGDDIDEYGIEPFTDLSKYLESGIVKFKIEFTTESKGYKGEETVFGDNEDRNGPCELDEDYTNDISDIRKKQENYKLIFKGNNNLFTFFFDNEEISVNDSRVSDIDCSFADGEGWVSASIEAKMIYIKKLK